jgi:transcriptional regulator with XRE-family HTH domain
MECLFPPEVQGGVRVMMMLKMVAVDDVIASLPKQRQKAIKARGNELLAKVERRMTIGEIRRERKISQAKMAEVLGIGQMQISRLEKRKDPRLSTMQRTVAAMGGHLTMIATFPDQEPVVIVTSPVPEKKTPASKKLRRVVKVISQTKGPVRARA